MGRSNTHSDVFRFIDTHGNDPEVCWEWTGHLAGRDGRGYFTIQGRRVLCYRLVYEIFNGPIPDGTIVRHKCDNPQCCNPIHLELGSQGDNEKDKYKRDRAGYPVEVVKQIKRLNKFGLPYRAIAEQIRKKMGYKISFTGVGRICREETRADVSIDDETEGEDDGTP